MQNVVDDVSLRLTAAGLTRTDTVVLLRLDSGALECKVYTGCVQACAASAGWVAMTTGAINMQSVTISIPTLNLQAGCPSCHPINSASQSTEGIIN